MFTFDIRPACLYTHLSDLPQNVPLFVTGWGRIQAESKFQNPKERTPQILFPIPVYRFYLIDFFLKTLKFITFFHHLKHLIRRENSHRAQKIKRTAEGSSQNGPDIRMQRNLSQL